MASQIQFAMRSVAESQNPRLEKRGYLHNSNLQTLDDSPVLQMLGQDFINVALIS